MQQPTWSPRSRSARLVGLTACWDAVKHGRIEPKQA
jgi:hypothetical protein